MLLKFAAAVTRAVSSARASQKALCVMKLSLLFVRKQNTSRNLDLIYHAVERKVRINTHPKGD